MAPKISRFGKNGVAIFPAGGRQHWPVKAGVLPDGKIVVASHVRKADAASPWQMGVVRFHGDGTVDRSFAAGGLFVLPSGRSGGQVSGLATLPDGKMVVSGYTSAAGGYAVTLFRLDVAGRLDSSFGRNGIFRWLVSGYDAYGRGLALQRDGKLLVNGELLSDGSIPDLLLLLRVTPDGRLDPGFGLGGVVRSRNREGRDSISRVAVQPSGRIVALGTRVSATGMVQPILRRFYPAGRPDPTFAAPLGVALLPCFGMGLELDAEGRVHVPGKAVSGTGGEDVIVARFTAEGARDTSFGGLGSVVFRGEARSEASLH